MIFINTYVKDIKGVQMKKIFIVVLALFFINFPILYCDASTEETIQEQKSEFQIQDFIKTKEELPLRQSLFSEFESMLFRDIH